MLNEEISEIFFYDKVLLVEGDSEKYFYNALSIKDENFQSYLVKNKMGIFSVYGIDFAPAKKILNKLLLNEMQTSAYHEIETRTT